MKKKRVYISGPMTGIKEYNYPVFEAAEDLLTNQGFLVINPARHPIGLHHNEYMFYAALDVQICDIVFQLPGWENSRGALKEAEWAIAAGKPVKQLIDMEIVIGKSHGAN